MIRITFLLLPMAFTISFLLTWLLVRIGRRLSMHDSSGSAGHIKPELRAVPNIGGVAVFLTIAIPMLAALLLLLGWDQSTWNTLLPAVVEHLPRMRETAPTVIALLICLASLHTLGLIDDRRPISPWIKLAVQLLAAAVMVMFFNVRLLTMLGPGLSIVLTILWIIAITNAINFIDNMDGLCAGVCAIASTMFMIAALINSQWFIADTLALMIGALVGFLCFNMPPAKIFLGDGGSLVIGFLLAVLTARTTYYETPLPEQAESFFAHGWYGVFMPIIVLAIPLYDFITVTTIRIAQGRSPFVGDQQHFSHRLVQRGLTPRGAVILIWGFTLITSVSGIALRSLQPWQAALVGMQTMALLGVLWLLEHTSRHAASRHHADHLTSDHAD